MSNIIKKLKQLRLSSILLFKPLSSIILIFILSLMIFIFGGGVYDIMETPLAVLPTPSNPIFYYPGMAEQFLNESIIFILFLVMGIGGGFLAYRSTRYSFRPREARLFLLIGLSLLIIAFLGCELMLVWKGI